MLVDGELMRYQVGHKVPCTTLRVEAKPLPDDMDEAGVVWEFRV